MFYDVGFEVLTAVVIKSIIFWDMTLCSPLSFNRRFSGTYRLHLQGRRNRFSKIQQAQMAGRIIRLKMEAICSSETSVETQLTTGHHIPEDDTLQSLVSTHNLTNAFHLSHERLRKILSELDMGNFQ
jgi:hypothetical protein